LKQYTPTAQIPQILQLAFWNVNGLTQHIEEMKNVISIHNIYEKILQHISIYGIQLWDTASTSNIEILECFQSKAQRMTVDALWYVPNTVI
jgi:hypothetical protein